MLVLVWVAATVGLFVPGARVAVRTGVRVRVTVAAGLDVGVKVGRDVGARVGVEEGLARAGVAVGPAATVILTERQTLPAGLEAHNMCV